MIGRSMREHWRAESYTYTYTFGCTNVQNNQVEMGTTTPEGILHGQKSHCKGNAVRLS